MQLIDPDYCDKQYDNDCISLCQGPKPADSARRKKTFRCFVIGPINCRSESENFLKFLLTRANFSKFNPFQETSPGDFGTGISYAVHKPIFIFV
jgi:hypothetical protein